MHIPAEVAQELVLEGWLERIVRETAVEPLVLPDVGPSASTAVGSSLGPSVVVLAVDATSDAGRQDAAATGQ